MPETTDYLEQERQRIQDAIARMQSFYQDNQAAQDLAGFYQRPEYQQNFGYQQQQAAGTNVPYTPDVIASMIADSTSGNARNVEQGSALARRQFANAGLGGGPLMNALVNMRNTATAQNTAARRDITSRAQLSNFQARERAQQQINAMLQQQLAAQQQLVSGQQQQSNLANQTQIGVSSQAREIGPGAGQGGVAPSSNDWISRWHAAQASAPTYQPGGYGMQQQPGVYQQQQNFSRNMLAQRLAGF